MVQVLLEFLLYLITKGLQMLMVGTLGSVVSLGWVGQLGHDQNVPRGSVVQILLEFLLYLITKVLQMLMVGTLGSVVTLVGWVGQLGHNQNASRGSVVQ